jgi:hypothetical protein
MKDVLGVYERKERFLEKWVEYEGRQKSSSLALHTVGYERPEQRFSSEVEERRMKCLQNQENI